MDTTAVEPSPPGAFIPFAFPGLPSVGCAFGTSLTGTLAIGVTPGGDTEAVANRRRAMKGLGLDCWTEARQVHGAAVLVDPDPTPPDEAPSLEADGLCTEKNGLGLLIKTADCQPLLLADAKGRAVAALHVGWRGNAMNFPAAGLGRFCEAYGLDPGEVFAVRGPSLGPGASEFVNFQTEWPSGFAPWFNETTWTVHLWELTRHQLVQAGMRREHIFSLDLCTYSLHRLFFSHRRGHSGRQGSCIWIRSATACASGEKRRATGL